MANKKVLVILDSLHTAEHVTAEIDETRERFMISNTAHGHLRRVR